MNPFTPTFGTPPPLLAGRDADLDDFRLGLQSGPGAPERATLVTGLRGSGKTVMLGAYEDIALEEGWFTISETATPGLLDRLVDDHLPRLLNGIAERTSRSTVTGVKAGPLGMDRDVTDLYPVTPSLRSRLAEALVMLQERSSGLLVTVDEVHRAGIADLRILGAEIQHCFRDRLPIAFAGAGLASSVSDVLADDVLTFLRRADRRQLHGVDRQDVSDAIRVPIEENGRAIGEEALAIAVEGTGGFPFLIQLVGLHAWRAAGANELISSEHAERGVQQARRKVGQLVHAPSLVGLSDVDRSFLVAMSVDDGPSSTSEIAKRLGVSAVYAAQYRRRLMEAELIAPSAYGYVDFTLPGLRDYLRGHAASSAWFQPG